MEKNKGTTWQWMSAILTILGVLVLIAAAIFAILNIEIISNECSDWKGPKPYFDVAMIIAGIAFGLQILAIIFAFVGKASGKKKINSLVSEV